MNARSTLFLAAAALALTTPGVRSQAEPVEAPEGYTLAWHDEFDVDGTPDPTHWGHELGFQRNEELQLYTDRPENARVEDGVLVIEARKEEAPNPGYHPDATPEDWWHAREVAHYTSAAVRTKGKHAMTHGRVAVRAKLPEGRGNWLGIWLLADNYVPGGPPETEWPMCGEIDLMEFVGYQEGVVHTSVHTAARSHATGNAVTAQTSPGDLHDTFRVYAVEWDEEVMNFFVDDEKVLTYENDGEGKASWPFDEPFHLILNVSVGGGWGGKFGVDDSIFPQRMEVDWVRVFDRVQ